MTDGERTEDESGRLWRKRGRWGHQEEGWEEEMTVGVKKEEEDVGTVVVTKTRAHALSINFQRLDRTQRWSAKEQRRK